MRRSEDFRQNSPVWKEYLPLKAHRHLFVLASPEHLMQDELRMALELSMRSRPEGSSTDSFSSQLSSPELQVARSRSSYLKPLSLIWACPEWSYSAADTLIVDDSLDGMPPPNQMRASWQLCIKYTNSAHRCSAAFLASPSAFRTPMQH